MSSTAIANLTDPYSPIEGGESFGIDTQSRPHQVYFDRACEGGDK